MDKIYLVVIDMYGDEENSIVDICTTYEKAEELIAKYIGNAREEHGVTHDYHIDEVELDPSKEILWDCYNNPHYVEIYGERE